MNTNQIPNNDCLKDIIPIFNNLKGFTFIRIDGLSNIDTSFTSIEVSENFEDEPENLMLVAQTYYDSNASIFSIPFSHINSISFANPIFDNENLMLIDFKEAYTYNTITTDGTTYGTLTEHYKPEDGDAE